MFSSFSLSSILISGGFLLSLVALCLAIFVALKQRALERKLDLFFSGKDGKSLETILVDQLTETKALDREIQELFEAIEQLRALGLKSLHKHSVLRFNPFKEVGSNQSFSVALLDGTNSGILLSSLHTREGTRVYAKPVERGAAKGFPFTEEEKAVIQSTAATKVFQK